MKDQLIELSRDKRFLSKDRLVEVYDDYYYLWLCELQKWLRERHDFYIWVVPLAQDNYKCSYSKSGGWSREVRGESWELALEAGLNEALKLV